MCLANKNILKAPTRGQIEEHKQRTLKKLEEQFDQIKELEEKQEELNMEEGKLRQIILRVCKSQLYQ